ncbi:hypothetical protein ISS03_01465 [Patescibacteria group bacterium]|nr:hypothetical protein [Patescibacteria group bacterium]
MKYLKTPERTRIRQLTIPVIIPMIIPLVLFDVFLEIYHQICFRVYRIPIVKRGMYIKVDRYKLVYLSFWQKVFCVYCGYANGLMHYATAIVAKTEEYWCGIQHKSSTTFKAPTHHKKFAKYNSKEEFCKKYKS